MEKIAIKQTSILGRSVQIQLKDGTRLWFKAWWHDGSAFDGTDEEALNRRIQITDIEGLIDGATLRPIVAA